MIVARAENPRIEIIERQLTCPVDDN
jgi:hypothetical protein